MTRIKEETDIVSVVREYVTLKPAGTSFKGLCPFHREKTPSFHVNPQRQIFKCFGCGEGGDAISFLMKLQGLAFPEAIEVLARPLNIDLARYLTDHDETEGERQAYFRALEAAAEIFEQEYWGDAGAEARAYLEARGFAEEIVRRYQVGFARSQASWLAGELDRRGVSRDLALRADLLRTRDGGAPFAYFRNRVIFPVKNVAQRVAGFGGRILGDGEPKYLNTAENPYFNKRQLLYGFAHSRIPIARHRKAILVEGYLDLMALAQAGYANAVATCGTAFTEDQARMLHRSCRTVYVLFDGDRAGRKAAVKSAAQALSAGLEPRVALLPDGEDPASFLGSRDAAALGEILEAAPTYLPLLRRLADESGLGREGVERAAKTALATLAGVPDPIRRAYLTEECAEVFELPREVVAREVARIQAAPRSGPPEAEERPPAPAPLAVPQGARLLGVDPWRLVRQMLVHAVQDDDGKAARALLQMEVPYNAAPPWARLLRDDLMDWEEERDRGTAVSPSAFVQGRWHERDDAYRQGVADLLNDQEGAVAADHEGIVRDCHQRLELVRNRQRELEALRAHARGEGE